MKARIYDDNLESIVEKLEDKGFRPELYRSSQWSQPDGIIINRVKQETHGCLDGQDISVSWSYRVTVNDYGEFTVIGCDNSMFGLDEIWEKTHLTEEEALDVFPS